MTEEAKVITIDGTEYKQEDLTQDQIHLINKASKWQAEANRLKENFDEILGEIKKPVSRETDLTNYRADVYQNPLFDFIMNL